MSTLKFTTTELTEVHWFMPVPAADVERVNHMSSDEQEEYLNDHQSQWIYSKQGTSETTELAGRPRLEPDP